jgi:hypothetical protein
MGEFVIFEGAVYYTFNRQHNAGDLAFKTAQYDANRQIVLCCDFNVNPMAWVVAQTHENNGMKEIKVIDEIFLKNSNTIEACREFKDRYPNHNMGIALYGDATGKARSTQSNVTNYQIIENELQAYGVENHVGSRNPAERDRVNAVNAMICNSQGKRRIQVNPKCENLIRDFEQVAYKNGSVQIDKNKDLKLTHASDAFGYYVESEFGLDKRLITGLRI